MTHCTRLKRLLGWILILLISAVVECSSNSPPGKPVFKQCKSPDKETFTCWWEPDRGDGEDTKYRLFYERDQQGLFECADYRTAGKNSCFFDKNRTSVWVEYFLTVVAFNSFGNTSSEVFKIDVMDIVKANPPENVTVRLDLSQDYTTIHVTWNPYHIVRNYGWLTTKYQVRFKKEDTETIMDAGIQTQFKLYNAFPGKQYLVQVRCSIDNGRWGEWSNATYIQIPKAEPKQQSFWILIAFFSAIPFFAALCILYIKRKFIKQWLLPPVPGPKIKGVDVHLLKNGRPEEVTSTLLINQVFPPMTAWKYQVEEYLIVCDHNLLVDEGLKGINGMIISNKFDSEANINEELNKQNDVNHKEKVQTLDYFGDISESGFINELKCVNPMETEKAQSITDLMVVPVENSSYVDVPQQGDKQGDMRHAEYTTVTDITGEHIIMEKQSNTSDSKNTDMNRLGEEMLPDDYTRVKEVKGDYMVLLQDPSCGNDGQYTDCGNHKPPYPLDTGGSMCRLPL